VSMQEITALIQRHLIAVLVVGVVAIGVAYSIKHTQPEYEESGTIVLTGLPVHGTNPYGDVNASLIATAGTLALMMMSPQSQQQVRAAGGTAAYDLTPVNFYNQEFPSFSAPDITVAASSTDPSAVHPTFTVVTQLAERELADQEARAGVPAADRIAVHVIGDTGPLPQIGSKKRVFTGLFVLTIVAVFTVAVFLDRHPLHLGLRRRGPPAVPSVPAGEAGRRAGG
jgi:hypothetical protein